MNKERRWLVVVIYAVAMAWVESAVVLYLRTLINRVEPYQPNPFPEIGGMARTEIIREAATLIMILAVGILAGTTWRNRLGYSAIAFGIWDIFYYVFLKVMCGWPHSVTDWDILFLIPLPWWGPVIAPVSISILLIIWGALVSRYDCPATATPPKLVASALGVAGIILGLGVFMADAITAAPQGVLAVRNVLPKHFNWPLFWGALILMAVPVIHLAWNLLKMQRSIGLAAEIPRQENQEIGVNV